MNSISSGYQVSGSGVGLFHVEMEVLVVFGGGEGNNVGGSVMAPDGGKEAYLRTVASELRSRLDALLLPAGNVGGLAAMLSGRQEVLPSVISRDMERLLAETAKAATNFDGCEGDSKRREGGGGLSSLSGRKIVYELCPSPPPYRGRRRWRSN